MTRGSDTQSRGHPAAAQRGDRRGSARSGGDDCSPAGTTVEETTVRLRRGQRFSVGGGDNFVGFRLDSGCLMLEADIDGSRRQIVTIVYPGEVVPAEAVPPLAGVAFVAAANSVVAKMRVPAHGAAASWHAGASSARLLARAGLHAVLLGQLTGEERVATLLIEQVLMLAPAATGSCAFDQPLSRIDMADYLALNPGTLSRHIARLKSMGVLATPTRTKAVVTDLAALWAMSPLAEALVTLHKRKSL